MATAGNLHKSSRFGIHNATLSTRAEAYELLGLRKRVFSAANQLPGDDDDRQKVGFYSLEV